MNNNNIFISESKTCYDDVKTLTTEEYFEGNKFSIDAFNKKYSLFEGETYVDAIKRVCDSVASVEKTAESRKYWSDRWFDEIFNDWWHPAGSIMQGAGANTSISLANCTTLSLGTGDDSGIEWDNLESIIKNTAYDVAKCAAFRQGLGVDFSKLRPRGTSVMNAAKESTGAVHWMQFFDKIGYSVGQSGRLPAFLFSLSCDHPDVEEFIEVKKDYSKIQNANISVQCTDAFYDAVKNDLDWELKFEIPEVKRGDKIYLDVHSIDLDSKREKETGKYYKLSKKDRKKEVIVKTVKARKLLELIAKNMHSNAEPGIQNIDVARKYSNSDAVYDPKDPYCSKIISTNACCITGDTTILTDRGWKNIKELYDMMKEGERFLVMSYNISENKYELKEILNSWQQRNDLTVTLLIEESGKKYEVECSSDHPILTRNRGYVRADSLTIDDDIMIYA
jgi:ribonucleotide reductase alpha subunit